jgi:hypothetical protein
MGSHLVRSAAVMAGLALIVAAVALGNRTKFCVENLCLRDNGRVVPAKVPRHEQAPVSAILDDEITTIDGSHPPAFEGLSAYFDKNIEVHAKGLPACKKGQLETRSTAAAKSACPDAIVGSGEAEVEVAFSEQKPFTARGPLVVFNGGLHGDTTLLFIHAYVAVPAPTAVVAVIKVMRVHRGLYGLHVVAHLPKIAGGAGSVIQNNFKIHRTFTYKGKKESFLTASCPAGHYNAEGRVHFRNGLTLNISHLLPCTPIK